MSRAARIGVACWLVLSLMACAAPVPVQPPRAMLRLSPASLGTTLALQQQLTATVGRQAHRFDVLLEADAQSVRLAVVSVGQTAARLEWDGVRLTQSRAPWWPEAVTADRILDDLQLMLWPVDAVRAALPPGWTLEQAPGERVLRHGSRDVVRVQYASARMSELVHLAEGYRVRVESISLEPQP
jgi:hypothetical protein